MSPRQTVSWPAFEVPFRPVRLLIMAMQKHRFTRRVLLFRLAPLVVLTAWLNSECHAADAQKDFFETHQDYMDLSLFNHSDTYIQYLYKPRHHEAGQTEKTDLSCLYAEADAGASLDSDTVLYADIEYTCKRYHFDDPEDLNRRLGSPTLHQIQFFMDVEHFFTDELLADWTFSPCISSDLSHDINQKDFQWTTGPIMSYRLTPHLAMHAGVQASVDEWHQSVYPLGGISYFSPDQRIHLNIIAPFMIRVGYTPVETTEYYASAWYSDVDVHAYLGPAATDSQVKTKDLQAGCGVVRHLTRYLNLTAECGLAFENSFAIKEDAAGRQDAGSGVAPYFSLSLGAVFNETRRQFQ